MPTRNVLGEEVKALDTKHAELFAKDKTEETTTELYKDTIYKDILYTKEKIKEIKENEANKPPTSTGNENENNASLDIPKLFKTEKANCVFFLATNDFYNKNKYEEYSIPSIYIPNSSVAFSIMHTSLPRTIRITKNNRVQNNACFVRNDLLAKIYVEKGWHTAAPWEYEQLLKNPSQIQFMSEDAGIQNTQAFIDGYCNGVDSAFFQKLNTQMNNAGLYGANKINTLNLGEYYSYQSLEHNVLRNPTPHKIISAFIDATEEEVSFVFNKSWYSSTHIYNGVKKCNRSAYASTSKSRIGYQHYETKSDPNGYFEAIRVFLNSYNKLVKAHNDFYNNQTAMAKEYNLKYNQNYIITKLNYSMAGQAEAKLTNTSNLFMPFNQSTYDYLRKYLTDREIFFLNPQLFYYSDLFKDKKYSFGSNTMGYTYFFLQDNILKVSVPNQKYTKPIDPNFLSYILVQENFYDGEINGDGSGEQPPAEVNIFNSYDLLKEYILKMPFNYEKRIEILKSHIQEVLKKIEVYYNGAYAMATHEQKGELKNHYDKFLKTIAKETDILAHYKSQKEKTLALLEELKNEGEVTPPGEGEGEVTPPGEGEGEDITQQKEIIFDYKGNIYLFVGESITIYTIRGGDFVVNENPNLSYQDVSEAKLLRSDYKVTALKEGKHTFVIREGSKEFVPMTFIVFNMEKVELAKPELAKLAFYARKYFKNAGDCVENGTIGDYYKQLDNMLILGLFNATKDNFIPIGNYSSGDNNLNSYWNSDTKCYNKLNVQTRQEVRGSAYKVRVTYKPTPDTTPAWRYPIFLLKDKKNYNENPQELTDFINKIFTKGALDFQPTQYPASDILPMIKEAYDGRNTVTYLMDNVTWFNSADEINRGDVGLFFDNMFCGYFQVVARKLNDTTYRVLETASQDVTYSLDLNQFKNQAHIHNAKSVWLEDFQNLKLSDNTKFILDNADFFKQKASQDHWYYKPSLPIPNTEGWGNEKKLLTKFSEFQPIYTPKTQNYDVKRNQTMIMGYAVLEYYKSSKDAGTKIAISKVSDQWTQPPNSIINNITRNSMPYNIDHRGRISVKLSELQNKTLSILIFCLGNPFYTTHIGTDSGKNSSYICTDSIYPNPKGAYFYNDEGASIDENLVELHPDLNFCESYSSAFNIKFTRAGTYNICFWTQIKQMDSIDGVKQSFRHWATHSISIEIRVT